MAVILDDSDTFEWAEDVTGGNYFAARDVARSRIDLRGVVESYTQRPSTDVDGTSFKARCFLPSRVAGFAGSCGDQSGNPANTCRSRAPKTARIGVGAASRAGVARPAMAHDPETSLTS